MTTALMIPLGQIYVDDQNQPRLEELDGRYIDQLAQVPELWPPVAVVAGGGDDFILVDGFHRNEAAKHAGLTEIAAVILEMPEDGDLASLGFDLNAKHGQPLTLDDRKAHARRLLRKDPTASDRSISVKSGVAAATVASIRRSLEQGAQIEQSAERVGADGRVYTRPDRRPGELPEASIGEFVSDGAKNLLSSPELRRQRKVVRYLERLKTALADSEELEGWNSSEDVAQACINVLGQQQARQLAHELERLIERIWDPIFVIVPPN